MAPLLALIAGGKGKAMGKSAGSDMPMEPDADDSGAPDEKSFAGDAFDALKDGDREGFVNAFLQAVRACSKADYSSESEPDADDEG